MIKYDLTHTRLFKAPTRAALPGETELFLITVALLLVREVPFSDPDRREVVLSKNNIEDVHQCITQRFSDLACDIESNVPFRQRLDQLVGLRIRFIKFDSQQPQAPR